MGASLLALAKSIYYHIKPNPNPNLIIILTLTLCIGLSSRFDRAIIKLSSNSHRTDIELNNNNNTCFFNRILLFNNV